jgi:hypothetical protein
MRVRIGVLKGTGPTLALLFALWPVLSAMGLSYSEEAATALGSYSEEKWYILDDLGISLGRHPIAPRGSGGLPWRVLEMLGPPVQVRVVEDAELAKILAASSGESKRDAEKLVQRFHSYRNAEDVVRQVFRNSSRAHYGERSWVERDESSDGSSVTYRFDDVEWSDSSIRYKASFLYNDSNGWARVHCLPKGYQATFFNKEYLVKETAESNSETILVRAVFTDTSGSRLDGPGDRVESSVVSDEEGRRMTFWSVCTTSEGREVRVFVDDEEDEFVGFSKDPKVFWVFYNLQDGKVRLMINGSCGSPSPDKEPRETVPQTPSQGTIKQWLAMSTALSKVMEKLR